MTRFYTNVRGRTLVVKPTYLELNNGYPVVKQGERLKFVDGEIFLDEKTQSDKIDFLRNHQDFNLKFFEEIEQTVKVKTKTKD